MKASTRPCLRRSAWAMLLALPWASWPAQGLAAPSPAVSAKALEKQYAIDRKLGFKGEYFLTRSMDPVCAPFTKNLNQFRRIDFDECHPRLSKKFPEFTRPEWNEVPLDLNIAEKAFKDIAGPRLEPGKGAYWRDWLETTKDLRAKHNVKMWIAAADINNDGNPDQIARVQYAKPASDLPTLSRSCRFSESGLWKMNPGPPTLLDGQAHFYFGLNSDIIHSSKTGLYYAASYSRVAFDPDLIGKKIGATRTVIINFAPGKNGALSPACFINWVPTGKYNPWPGHPS